MLCIGTIEPDTWNRMLFASREPSQLLPPQPENSPYIIAIIINEYQSLAITGLYEKGKVELIILEIQRPDSTPKNRVPIPTETWLKARELAIYLSGKVVLEKTQATHTSSITNQLGSELK